MTRASGLDVVFARPTRLSNGGAKAKYVRTAELIGVHRQSLVPTSPAS
jgi:hypothetical protein